MNTTDESQRNETITLYDLAWKTRQGSKVILKRWWWLLLLSVVVGGCLGLLYSAMKKETYTARLSFLVEEGKGGGGGIAALAGQFGFDIGGLGGASGLLSGDNVLVFLKSTSLAKMTLLSPYDPVTKTTLADRYAETTKLREAWKANPLIGKEIRFSGQPFSRLQDSLLHVLVERVLKNDYAVDRPDKKASFVQVTVTMRDELLAKLFCERLVAEATSRYVSSKTTRQAVNVAKLQRRADSIGALLNRKTFATAAAQEILLDLNPGMKTATVNAEVTGRDKMMLQTIYGEVIKNLEISKVALSQETPAILIVDPVDLPLKVNRVERRLAIGLGCVTAVSLCLIVLIVRMLFSQTTSARLNHAGRRLENGVQ